MGNVNDRQENGQASGPFDRVEEGRGLVNEEPVNDGWFSSAERRIRNSLGAEGTNAVAAPPKPKDDNGTFTSSVVNSTTGLARKLSGALGGAVGSTGGQADSASKIENSSWSKMPFGASGISSSISSVTGATENPCPFLPEMTYRQRIMGFVLFFVLGSAASMISTMYVPLIVVRPSKFAIPYTVGNLMSIGSTAFLVGPWRQVKNMFDSTRMVGSLVFLTSMVGTLYFAFVLKSGVGVLTCVIIQFAAYLWYVASYIPFGRSMMKKFACGCFQCMYKCLMRG